MEEAASRLRTAACRAGRESSLPTPARLAFEPPSSAPSHSPLAPRSVPAIARSPCCPPPLTTARAAIPEQRPRPLAPAP